MAKITTRAPTKSLHARAL